jgi:integrase
MSDLEAAGVSPTRRRYARVVLRIALNTALRWDLVVRNAATLVDAPRVSARVVRPFTPEEARAFLKAVEDHPLEALFTVGLTCGLRIGEALGLQWNDCNLDDGTLAVRRALQRFGGDATVRRGLLVERRRLLHVRREALKAKDLKVVETTDAQLATVRLRLRDVKSAVHAVEPKSARSRRTIALPTVVVKALGRHRVRQLEARMAAGSAWQETGYVFTSSIGTPVDARNVTRAFKAVLEAAKLPNIRVHDLRHSCATLLLAQGVSPRVVMETLGHSQVSLTPNTCSHVLPALELDAAAQMDAALKARRTASVSVSVSTSQDGAVEAPTSTYLSGKW